MSDHHQDNDSTTQISSSEITPTRPRQEGKLALLPTELLLSILSETEMTRGRLPLDTPETIIVRTNVLSASDMKNLALASSSLFYRVRPSFHLADNCHAFRSALKRADVEAMKRCAEFGAAPDVHWDLEDECKCKGSSRHLSHRPIDVLLVSVKHGSVPINKSIEALKWLLYNEYDASEQTPRIKDFKWWSSLQLNEEQKAELKAQLEEACSMPEILLHTLAQDTDDRTRIEGICQMIYMLLDHGYLIPYNINVYQNGQPGKIDTPMNAAMHCHCPPHFLRVLLELYKRHDAHNQRTADECPESMESWVGWSLMNERLIHMVNRKWRHRPSLNVLAWSFFLTLFDPAQAWKEAYNGEIADMFEEKINLLEKYNFIDSIETQALRGILEALRSIATMSESLGGLDRARDGKKCWQLICDPLRPVFFDLTADISYMQRVHRFEFHNHWNPWVQYYKNEYLQQNHISVENPPYPWIKEGSFHQLEDGKVIDENFRVLSTDGPGFWRHREGRLPWIEYNYDGFLERLSKEWYECEKECGSQDTDESDVNFDEFVDDSFDELDDDSDMSSDESDLSGDDSDMSEYVPDEDEMDEDWD